MAAPYLTPQQAAARLMGYGIDATPTEGDVTLASNAVDRMGPFVGERAEGADRSFPRTVTLSSDTEGIVPEAVLDAASILSVHQLLDEGEAASKARQLVYPYRRKTGRLV